jgi:hypothetical protein
MLCFEPKKHLEELEMSSAMIWNSVEHGERKHE